MTARYFYLLFSFVNKCSLDNVLNTDDVPPDIDQTLGLVAVGEEVDDAVGEEVGGDGVTTQTAHVGPQDPQHLVQELLDEGGEAADLSDVAALPDEEEVEGAEVLIDLGSGDERARADVDAEGFV